MTSSELSKSYNLIIISSLIYSFFSLPQWSVSLCMIPVVVNIFLKLTKYRNLKPNMTILIFLLLNILLLVGSNENRGSEIIQGILTLYLSSSLLMKYRNLNYQVSLVLCFLVLALGSRENFSTINIIIMIIFYALITWTLFLNQNIDRRIIDFSRLAKNILKILIQIMPIVILIFVLLPRYVKNNPLQFNSSTGVIGISDSLKPGSLSKLAATDKIAFLAKDKRRSHNNLYWKLRFLDKQFGIKWMESKVAKSVLIDSSKLGEIKGDVNIINLDNSNTYIPFIYNISPNKNTILPLQGGSYTVDKESFSNLKYDYTGSISRLSSNINYLQTENINSSEANKMGVNLKERFASNPTDIVKYLGKYISENNFSYSLEPLKKSRTIDDFIFADKIGYCEHYASAFAYVLRAADVKTRVVLGYQGGTYNSTLSYYSVFSRDAHAWIEYWDNDRWNIFDPTYILAPTRINRGFKEFIREQQTSKNLISSVTLPLVWWIQDLNENLKIYFEVVYYQNLILDSKNIFMNSLLKLTKDYSNELLMMLLLILFGIRFRRRSKTSELDKWMRQYTILMQRYGYIKQDYEGFKEFVDRICLDERFVESDHQLFINLWVQDYYHQSENSDLIRESLRSIKGGLKVNNKIKRVGSTSNSKRKT